MTATVAERRSDTCKSTRIQARPDITIALDPTTCLPQATKFPTHATFRDQHAIRTASLQLHPPPMSVRGPITPRASASHNTSSLAFFWPSFCLSFLTFFCSLMIPSCAFRPIGILSSSSLEEPHYGALVPRSGCFIAARGCCAGARASEKLAAASNERTAVEVGLERWLAWK